MEELIKHFGTQQEAGESLTVSSSKHSILA